MSGGRFRRHPRPRSRHRWHLGLPHTIWGRSARSHCWRRPSTCTGPTGAPPRLSGDRPDRRAWGPGARQHLVRGFRRRAGSRPRRLRARRLAGTRRHARALRPQHAGRAASPLSGGRAFPRRCRRSCRGNPAEIRLSFMLVSPVSGNNDLRVSTPHNARIEAVPSLARRARFLSHRPRGALPGAVRDAGRRGRAVVAGRVSAPRADQSGPRPQWRRAAVLRELRRLPRWRGAQRAGEEGGDHAGGAQRARHAAPADLPTTATRSPPTSSTSTSRRCASTARSQGGLLVHHRVRRASDGRLIAVATAERQLRDGTTNAPR